MSDDSNEDERIPVEETRIDRSELAGGSDDDTITARDLRPHTGFYHGGVHVETGRLFRAVDMEDGQFLLPREVDTPNRRVVFRVIVRGDDGELETGHGTLRDTGEERHVNWIEQAGRFMTV